MNHKNHINYVPPTPYRKPENEIDYIKWGIFFIFCALLILGALWTKGII
jgi:hypothetical protein